MEKAELKAYLVDEAEYSEEEVNSMTDFEMLDAWLIYNGIIGYTRELTEVLSALGIRKKW